MIARLRGTLEEKGEGRALVDVQGVGYGLLVPDLVIHKLPEPGHEVTLRVYTHVREDQITLFGFSSALEQDVFLLLMSASGVGPKVALAILSNLDAMQILDGVVRKDNALFSGISGVGKKTVEKLFVEIREKAEKRLLVEKGAGFKVTRAAPVSSVVGGPDWMRDLEGALLSFGYKDQDVKNVLRDVSEKPDQIDNFDAALRYGLQFLSGSGNKGLRGNA